MKDLEVEKLQKFGQEPPWAPSDENRPNEDRPPLVRPALEHSEWYNWIINRKPIDYRRWYNEKLTWRILPAEEKHRSCARRMALETGIFRTLLPEVYGDIGYGILDAAYASFAATEYAAGRARGLIKDVEQMGPREAGAYIATVWDIEGLQPLVVAEAPEETVTLQAMVGKPDVCIYGTRRGDWRFCVNTGGWERELVKLMNPKLRARPTKSKNCGDYCCEVTVDWDTGEYAPAEPITERPEPVRPELKHSEIYDWVMYGKPKDTTHWQHPVPYRILPWEAKHRSCSRRYAAEVGCLRTLIAEFFGDQGYELIEKAYASFAVPEYEMGRARGLIKDPDQMGPIDVAKYLSFLYDVIGRGVISIPEVSNERVRIQYFHGPPATCHYLVREGDWRMCVAETAFEREFTKLMNPKLRARRTKGKVYGDYCCELTIDWEVKES